MRKQFITVPLTRGHFTVIDAEDADFVLQHRWTALVHGPWVYAHGRVDGKLRYLHRILMNAPGGASVDHRNNNGIDNRKSNLRLCANAQNGANSPRRKIGASGLRGVQRDPGRYKETKPWRAKVTHQRKQISLGNFHTPEEAARAYGRAARELFGEFAVLNFPDE